MSGFMLCNIPHLELKHEQTCFTHYYIQFLNDILKLKTSKK